MTLSQFTWLAYVYNFFREFRPIYPLYALMFTEVGNLSSQEVSLLILIWLTAAFTAEIPTGVVADKISRRQSAMIGQWLIVGTFVIWFFNPNFLGYAVGFIVWGFGFAFASGATDAYTFDKIKQLGGEAKYTQFYSRANSIKILGMFVAHVLAAVLISYGYDSVLLASIFASAIAPILLFFMPKDSMHHMRDRSYFSILKEAVAVIRSSKILLILATFLMIAGGIIGTLEEYMPLYFYWNDFSPELVAVLLTSAILVSAVTQWFAHRLDTFTTWMVYLLFGVAGIIVVMTSGFAGWVAVIGFFVFLEIMNFVQTSLYGRLHTLISTDARATVESMIIFVAEAIGIALVGVIITLQIFTSDVTAISLIAAGVAFFGLYYALWRARIKT